VNGQGGALERGMRPNLGSREEVQGRLDTKVLAALEERRWRQRIRQGFIPRGKMEEKMTKRWEIRG
jgi:hypothetical protein